MARVGAYGFYQHDAVRFGLRSGDGAVLDQSLSPTGHVEVAFAEDQYAANDWLTLNLGLRITRFSGALSEHAVNPRIGAAVRLPRWSWVVRGYVRAVLPAAAPDDGDGPAAGTGGRGGRRASSRSRASETRITKWAC